jgi:hypothetical protein
MAAVISAALAAARLGGLNELDSTSISSGL